MLTRSYKLWYQVFNSEKLWCLTGVVWHGGLLLVPLFLELNVSQLHDGGAHLQDI